MNKKKIMFLVILSIVVSTFIYFIYNMSYKEEFNYVALGDSLAAGRNPYGIDDYGYTDYVKDYLKNKDKLASFVSYAQSGYTIEDIFNDINLNKSVIIDNKHIGIKKALRESDIVTLSIGANDLLKQINLMDLSKTLGDEGRIKNYIDDILIKANSLLKSIKQYAKGKIIVVGYYNPVPQLEDYKKDIDNIISYIDKEYQKICKSNDIYYVQISKHIANNSEYLPNPLDIHPSKKGYKIISEVIISLINKEFF